MKDDHSWGHVVFWVVIMIVTLLLSKVIIEAVVESDMPMWLKIMLLK